MLRIYMWRTSSLALGAVFLSGAQFGLTDDVILNVRACIGPDSIVENCPSFTDTTCPSTCDPEALGQGCYNRLHTPTFTHWEHHAIDGRLPQGNLGTGSPRKFSVVVEFYHCSVRFPCLCMASGSCISDEDDEDLLGLAIYAQSEFTCGTGGEDP
jgi:hypothetical protein